MPDFKFNNGKIYFSAFSPSKGGHPLLLPYIADVKDNKGLISLIAGDAGITEKIMKPTLLPLVKSVMANPYVMKHVYKTEDEQEILEQLTEKAIPENSGIKAMEKTLITTMLDSYKPLMEVARYLIEAVAVAEDAVCRFTGTSIKVGKKEFGVPSRKPETWNKDLNYTETAGHLAKKLGSAAAEADDLMKNSMPSGSPLNETTDSDTSTKMSSLDQDILYVGYFDEDGNQQEPPSWIKNSKKWFSRDFSNQTVSVPFQQLDPDYDTGLNYMKGYYRQKNETLLSRIRDIEKKLSEKKAELSKIENKEIREQAIKATEAESLISIKILKDMSESLTDVLYGTDKQGSNKDNDGKINPPVIVSEYIGKVRSSQLRLKYFPEQQPTAQRVVDKRGRYKEPYVYMPKAVADLDGRKVEVEVPFAFPQQISTKEVVSSKTFYDKAQRYSYEKDKKRRRYSKQNVINNLDILAGTDIDKPYSENERTYFSHNIEEDYIPDNVKNYYLPLEWEEVSEYDIINTATGEKVKTETEKVNFSIDVEKDYELRVIKVVNAPLISNAVSSEYKIFPSDNTLLTIKKDSIRFMRYTETQHFSDCESDSGNLFIGDYIDEQWFNQGDLYYVRETLSYGSEIASDGVYKVQSITKIYETVEAEHENENTTVREGVITVKDSITIPSKIFNYDGNNAVIMSGVNAGKEIRITSVTQGSETVIEFDGDTEDDDIADIFTIKYIDRTGCAMNINISGSRTFYRLESPSFVPDNIQNSEVIMKGFDNESLYTALTDTEKRKNLRTADLTTSKADGGDGIYSIGSVKKGTENNVEYKYLKLNTPISKKFRYTISDENGGFHFPLVIVTVPPAPSDGSSVTGFTDTETGTLFTVNSNIPSDDTDTPVTDNLGLNEGIVYQGLDPRFVSPDKWKVFWLVEAVRKNENNKTEVNGREQEDETSGKEWYGLTDRLTVMPVILGGLLPIIINKIIPLAAKMIQLISNPKQITDLLITMGITDPAISKFPKYFKDYSEEGELGRIRREKNTKPADDFDAEQSGMLYTGPQKNGGSEPISLLDGAGIAEFGTGAFGKVVASFGVKLDYNVFSAVTEKGEARDNPLFKFILNIIKMPFEIMFKIFSWIAEWIKKLLNPAKIAEALKELLTFEWLKDILGKDTIFSILGITGANLSILKSLSDNLKNGRQNILFRAAVDEIQETGSSKVVEVLIYDIIMNGFKVGQEIEERVLSAEEKKGIEFVKNIDLSSLSGILFDIPLPDFKGTDFGFLGIQPAEKIFGLLKFLQETINGMLDIPISILGLEPTISIPKFGKEIPFADQVEKVIDALRSELNITNYL